MARQKSLAFFLTERRQHRRSNESSTMNWRLWERKLRDRNQYSLTLIGFKVSPIRWDHHPLPQPGFLITCSTTAMQQPSSDRPNVVLIMTDVPDMPISAVWKAACNLPNSDGPESPILRLVFDTHKSDRFSFCILRTRRVGDILQVVHRPVT
jgi:hypothetical protein